MCEHFHIFAHFCCRDFWPMLSPRVENCSEMNSLFCGCSSDAFHASVRTKGWCDAGLGVVCVIQDFGAGDILCDAVT